VKIFRGLLILSLLLACSPKRDNPFDLNSPEYEGYPIYGHVERIYNGGPIPDAEVSLWPIGRFTFADSSGGFTFSNLEPGEYNLWAEAQGFAAESLSITLEDPEGEEVNLLLDALPVLSRSRVITQVIDNTFPVPDSLNAIFRTRVYDPDGLLDIDTVFVIIEDDTFGLSHADSEYVSILPEGDLPGGTLESLLGTAHRFEVHDLSGNGSCDSLVYLTRIVTNYARQNSPVGGATVDPSPTLSWRPTFASYPVHFDIRIYLIDIGLPLVYSVESIHGDSTNYQVQATLSAGEHIWVIWTIDEHGNSARPEPALFNVQP
jgi:hypothetical protein